MRPEEVELLERSFTWKNGERNRHLWEGDWYGAKYSSQSEADLAFCGHIGWLFSYDPETMDRVFRHSRLLREKWNEMRGAATYAQRTIGRAIGDKTPEDGFGKHDPRQILLAVNRPLEKVDEPLNQEFLGDLF